MPGPGCVRLEPHRRRHRRALPERAGQIDFIAAGSEYGKRYGIQGQGSGRMPAFGNMLTDEQIEAIVEYVRSL